MIHLVGCAVTYHIGAFRTVSWPTGSRLFKAVPTELRSALDLGSKAIRSKKNGDWRIEVDRYLMDFTSDNIAAQLTVFVPAGPDQHDQLLEAIDSFEESVATYLGAPVDTAFRSIEEGGPKCEDCESRTIDWIRTTPYAGNERYFCDKHAQDRSDFGGNAATRPDNFMYVRQHPIGAPIPR